MHTNHAYIYRHNELLYTLTLRSECQETSNTSLPKHTVTKYYFVSVDQKTFRIAEDYPLKTHL